MLQKIFPIFYFRKIGNVLVNSCGRIGGKREKLVELRQRGGGDDTLCLKKKVVDGEKVFFGVLESLVEASASHSSGLWKILQKRTELTEKLLKTLRLLEITAQFIKTHRKLKIFSKIQLNLLKISRKLLNFIKKLKNI